MAAKTIPVDSIGEVAFHKRKGSRSLRVKVDMRGRVIVTMPHFVAYETAVSFVKQHQPWITEELQRRASTLYEGMRVGRIHILRFIYDATISDPRVRVTATQVVVTHNSDESAPAVQQSAHEGCVRALKREGAHFLPKRLIDIARAEGYDHGEVTVRQLKGRWGSCDQDKNITLNCYLMQLPVEYIDYVIYHELAHTIVMHHGSEFWAEFEAHLPDAKAIRKSMKKFQPSIPAERMA